MKLLYTNDLHGSVGFLPRIAAMIERERFEDDVLLFDSGDPGVGISPRLVRGRFDALSYDGSGLQ